MQCLDCTLPLQDMIWGHQGCQNPQCSQVGWREVISTVLSDEDESPASTGVGPTVADVYRERRQRLDALVGASSPGDDGREVIEIAVSLMPKRLEAEGAMAFSDPHAKTG